MKAAVYTKAESGKVLQISDLETPVPKDNEVLIKVHAASVNPLDWRLKKRRPGVDVAGEVVALGRSVTQFKPQDTVCGTGRGTFAEYACAPQTGLLVKPDYLSFEQAACLPVAGLTALQSLRDRGALQHGQKVLINGAAGGVGTFAVQIAKSLGAEVTAVCSTRNVEMVRSLGADLVIDYTQEDFTTTGCRYDLLLDNVGNHSLSDLKRVLTPSGRCVMAGAPKEFWPVLTGLIKFLALWPLLHRHFKLFLAKMKPNDLVVLCELTKFRKVTPVIDKRYLLRDAADAIAYVEKGHARGKVIIVVK